MPDVEFADFADLWEPLATQDEVMALAREDRPRADFVLGLGRCLAGLHERRILPDSHQDNFLLGAGGEVKLVDLGGIEMSRETPYATRVLAENLVSLLLVFSPVEWRLFRHGYVEIGGDDARRAIAYIEGGLEPWNDLISEERYADAAVLIDQQLDAASDDERRLELTLALGFCQTKDERHRRALEAYERALVLCRRLGGDSEPLILFNASKAAFRAGDRDRVVGFLEPLLATLEDVTDPQVLLEACWLRREIAAYDGDRPKVEQLDRRMAPARRRLRADGRIPYVDEAAMAGATFRRLVADREDDAGEADP